MTNVILSSIPLDELIEAISKCTKLQIDQALLQLNDPISPVLERKNSLLSRKETAQILGISLPTLHQWTKNAEIKSYKIGNTIRYKEEDVYEALQLQQYQKMIS